MTESHCLTIDGICLTEETDASEDGKKMASKKEWQRGGKCPDVRTNFYRRCIREGPERAFVRSTPKERS
ncbi:hypothetical protein TNIN_468941 [Trichonephila inaurata madagascariensis]|uniref:Uncharacterized protein n=1 Tax=Trichonephila inaurata madagascariensis TaxID=2747483 RepID=A0A8X6XQM4_9ARAC|nr:hypothetical protein TNIN_468941 [Trichonephila inaurata madagascariensis]